MKRLSLLIATCGIVIACDSPIEGPTETGPRLLPSFVVFGIVRDEAGLAVRGANAEIVRGAFQGRGSISNDSGYFSFAGVSGSMTVRVWKVGYERYVQDLHVAADLALDVRLPRLEGVDTILLGRTIRSSVEVDAPPCDSIGWDARAPCRRFAFTAPSSGVLVIRIAWYGGSPLDAVIMAPNGAYLATSDESGFEEITVAANVGTGEGYEIRVSSYYYRQDFDLRADLNSGTGR